MPGIRPTRSPELVFAMRTGISPVNGSPSPLDLREDSDSASSTITSTGSTRDRLMTMRVQMDTMRMRHETEMHRIEMERQRRHRVIIGASLVAGGVWTVVGAFAVGGVSLATAVAVAPIAVPFIVIGGVKIARNM